MEPSLPLYRDSNTQPSTREAKALRLLILEAEYELYIVSITWVFVLFQIAISIIDSSTFVIEAISSIQLFAHTGDY